MRSSHRIFQEIRRDRATKTPLCRETAKRQVRTRRRRPPLACTSPPSRRSGSCQVWWDGYRQVPRSRIPARRHGKTCSHDHDRPTLWRHCSRRRPLPGTREGMSIARTRSRVRPTATRTRFEPGGNGSEDSTACGRKPLETARRHARQPETTPKHRTALPPFRPRRPRRDLPSRRRVSRFPDLSSGWKNLPTRNRSSRRTPGYRREPTRRRQQGRQHVRGFPPQDSPAPPRTIPTRRHWMQRYPRNGSPPASTKCLQPTPPPKRVGVRPHRTPRNPRASSLRTC